MNVSKEGLDLIKRFEGLRLRAYKCPAGVWTIGYGHTRNVTRNQRITEAQADLFLEQDVRWALDTVKAAGVELTQNELDALVSFVYNVGMAAFNRSTMRALLQAGKPRDEVAKEFLRWNKAGGRVLSGLTARRLAEQQLFMRSN